MAQAYSYIRFSSMKQELGDSLRRQEKRALEYAARNNLILDARSYRDLGISAFKGQNAAHGNLNKFIAAVELGTIAKGSYLLVESLDRISRNDVDEALELLLSIIRKGIVVVTLDDEQVYSKERIKADKGISLIISIARMSRANEESAIKSYRVRQAWEAKRASGQILTSVSPAWLTLSPDRTSWIIDNQKAGVVQRIFELALDGNGAPSIARILNQENVATMQRAAKWSFGTVAAILKNDAVIGVYTPKKAQADPIPGYYPAIIDKTQFYSVQETLKNRRWVGGRNSQFVSNLFAGISYCHVCRSKMRTVGSSGRHLYMKCLNAYSGGSCTEGRFPYLAAELAVLRFLADEMSVEMTTVTNQDNSRAILQAEQEDVKQRLAKLLDVAETAADSYAIGNRIAKLEAQLRELERLLRDTVSLSEETLNLGEMHALFDKLKGLDGPMDRELRLKVKSYLRRMIDRVEFWCDADNDRPGVGVQFTEQYGGDYRGLDVRHYREKVGGTRTRKRT